MMFYSMKNKHDKQALLMLPASNFEKYLMRYSTWLILLPIYTVALLGADLIQYLVNIMMNHEYTTFVMSFIVDKLSNAHCGVGYAVDMVNSREWKNGKQ